MGFEIIFKYHEEIEKGEYNKEELKTKKVKVGSAEDDIELSVVAGKIMAQLARRNILVMEVEIYEFTKKKLSYKEAADGLVIKNKKFRFDDGAVVDAPAEVAPPVAAALPSSIPTPTPAAPAQNGGSPLRYEIYDPIEPALVHEDKRRGYKFTIGKRYPIYKEEIRPMGVQYTTTDDGGTTRKMLDKHFLPDVPKTLIGGFDASGKTPSAGPKLSFSDNYDSGMPVLRRG